MKYQRRKLISEENFISEIQKFNKEIKNMEICQCENSVKIYDFFDTEKEFIIVMELCDKNLLDILIEKEKGFNAEEIKNILLQLNNAFKLMKKNKIIHRDIKTNNILVKYLNEEKTKYKVLLCDYGISRQIASLTRNCRIIWNKDSIQGNLKGVAVYFKFETKIIFPIKYFL